MWERGIGKKGARKWKGKKRTIKMHGATVKKNCRFGIYSFKEMNIILVVMNFFFMMLCTVCDLIELLYFRVGNFMMMVVKNRNM